MTQWLLSGAGFLLGACVLYYSQRGWWSVLGRGEFAAASATAALSLVSLALVAAVVWAGVFPGAAAVWVVVALIVAGGLGLGAAKRMGAERVKGIASGIVELLTRSVGEGD